MLLPQTKIPYLFITGQSYSGSTLLSFLLNAHPDITTVSECGPNAEVNSQTYLCSCGMLMRNCPFFIELERQIKSRGSSFSLGDWKTRYHISSFRPLDILLVGSLRNNCLESMRDNLVDFYPGYKRNIRQISQRLVHLAQAALVISRKKIFVDALKDPMRIKFLKDIKEFDLKIVHLVKDVRASVASVIKHAKNHNIPWAARYWKRTNKKADEFRKHFAPKQWLYLRYSDLCSDPQGSVDKIADFVGVKRAILPEDYLTVEHHIIGNQMRLNSSCKIEEDLAWKTQLTEQDLYDIAKIAGTLNRYFGYDFP